MNAKTRVAIIGAGKRFREYFLPVLGEVSSRIELVGFVTKSGTVDPSIGINAPVYTSVEDLIQSRGKVDLALLLVNADLNATLCSKLIEYGIHVLVETPLSRNTQELKRLAVKAAKSSITISVAEGWPYLPMESFKHHLISDCDLFHPVIYAENDFRSYDYHGIAQLRRYLGVGTQFVSSEIRRNRYGAETWQMIQASFEGGGQLLSKHYGKRLPGRKSAYNSLRFYSSRASVISGCLVAEGPHHISYEQDGEPCYTQIQYDLNDHGHVKRIYADLESLGSYEWMSPFPDSSLDEHQLAVSYFVTNALDIAEGKASKPLYGPEQHALDIAMIYPNRSWAQSLSRKALYYYSKYVR